MGLQNLREVIGKLNYQDVCELHIWQCMTPDKIMNNLQRSQVTDNRHKTD